MTRTRFTLPLIASAAVAAFSISVYAAAHQEPAPQNSMPMEQAGGDRAAMSQGMMREGMMGQGMLDMPEMDPARGRKLFASKGCVMCHSVNGVGGEHAPPLDASTMDRGMNPFEFAAKMWRGAEAMIVLQRDELGEQIEFTGDELADIIAFTHHPAEQKKFSEHDIPHRMQDLMAEAHGDGGSHAHGGSQGHAGSHGHAGDETGH